MLSQRHFDLDAVDVLTVVGAAAKFVQIHLPDPLIVADTAGTVGQPPAHAFADLGDPLDEPTNKIPTVQLGLLSRERRAATAPES
ncbi:hypothetical protein TPB0596_42170 [Tsukamurella pulmonis]|nr:hypothetical protein TPB0596_42170 [Tsukamurella pulmonis]